MKEQEKIANILTKRIGLISQSKQIRTTDNISDDLNLGNNNKDRDNFSKKTITLEDDLNVIRTILRELKGTEKWTDLHSSVNKLNSTSSKKNIIYFKEHILNLKKGSKTAFIDIDIGYHNNTNENDCTGYIVTNKNNYESYKKAKVKILDEFNSDIIIDDKLVFGISRENNNKLNIFLYIEDGDLIPIYFNKDKKIKAYIPYRDAANNIPEDAIYSYSHIGGTSKEQVQEKFELIEDFLGLSDNEVISNFAKSGAKILSDRDNIIDAILKLDKAISNITQRTKEIVIIDENSDRTFIKCTNELHEFIEVFLNGQLLISDNDLKSSKYSKGDYTIIDNSIEFRFSLELDDVIIVKL